MRKKLFSFKLEGWSADAAFCCRAVSFAEAFCIFHEFMELYAWQNGIRVSRLSCTVIEEKVSEQVFVKGGEAMALGICERGT